MGRINFGESFWVIIGNFPMVAIKSDAVGDLKLILQWPNIPGAIKQLPGEDLLE